MNPAATTPDKRIPEIDGLRALAILQVLVWHYVALRSGAAPGTLWAKVNMLLRVTWSGVDLFFVLSGFLVGGILLSQRESPDYFKAFFGRRALRILPLYFAFLAICLPLGWPGLNSVLPETIAWIFRSSIPDWSFLTLTQNLAMAYHGRFAHPALTVTWSLAIEEQFYLLLPCLIRWVPVRRLPVVLLALMAGGIFMRFAMLAALSPLAGFRSYVLLPGRWDALFLGVLIAWGLRHPIWSIRLKILGRWLAWLSPLPVLVVALMSITAKGVIMAPTMTLWGYTVLALIYSWLVLLGIQGRIPLLGPLLRSPPMVWIGTVSYGIYLLHEPVSAILHGLIRGLHPDFRDPGGIAVTFLAVAVTFGLAALSWYGFERRFVQWGHGRLRYRKVPSPASRPTAPTPS